MGIARAVGRDYNALMSVPPTGTVTFLFTDIEGSTRLAREFPKALPDALARHHAIVQAAVSAHQGHVFRIIGDEFNTAFATAPDALAAALAVQRALHAQPSAELGPLHVRMGIHTGPATVRENDYEGYLTLSHTKRLMSTAYGGQILISQATAALLHGQLPADVHLLDLGEQRLKDFEQREHIYQTVTPDLPADFPPLQTPEAYPNNLPNPLTSFIGREHELAEVKRLLATTRLLTLSGVGGTGKTRLALKVASELLKTYADGAWFAELAPLSDPNLVPQAVASALGVREQAGRMLLDTLSDYLRGKQVLLILDNCEHVIGACAQLAEALLGACPALKILASSREALGIAGEVTWQVPSLSLPGNVPSQPIAQAIQYEAVRLFVERAKAAQPSFVLTEQNTPVVVRICERLDGIPLALELAAVRLTVLSPEQIEARLDDRFRLLTGGSRTALPRQQTLRALIDWSHSLLSDSECMVFRRLSVFAGGWTLEAAESVCALPEKSPPQNGGDKDEHERLPQVQRAEVLDLLSQLISKSLVVVDELRAAARYRMLETIRQYARDKLLASGETVAVRDRQLDFFLQFVETAELYLEGPEQLTWFARLEREHDNLRVALEWAVDSAADKAVRMAGALDHFWARRGHTSEGRRWIESALAQDAALLAGSGEQNRERMAARAKAFGALGPVTLGQSDWPAMQAALAESVRLWCALDNQRGLARALVLQGLLATFRGAADEAQSKVEESMALASACGDKATLSQAHAVMGRVMMELRGNPATARANAQEAIRLAHEIGNEWHVANPLMGLGMIVLSQGDWVAAHTYLEESMNLFRRLGDPSFVNVTKSGLAEIAYRQADYAQALSIYRELISSWLELGNYGALARCLEVIAFCCKAQQHAALATRLLGAAESLRARTATTRIAGERVEYEHELGELREQFGDESFTALWAEGQSLTMEQAITLAMKDA